MTEESLSQADKQALLQAEITRLQGLFRDSLPQRFQDMDAAWQATLEDLKAPVFETENLKTFHRLVHTLTGSAGTFGLPKLSQVARTLEVFVKSIITPELTTITPAQIQQVEEMLVLVKQASIEIPFDKVESKPTFQVHQKMDLAFGGRPSENRILLLEEDENLVRFLLAQFANFGYVAKALSDIQAAEAEIQNFQPNILITDIGFGDDASAGIDLVARLREQKDESLAKLPVIFISGRMDIQARLEVVRATANVIGGASYFTKPLNLSALMDKVVELTSEEHELPYQVLIVDDDQNLCDWMSAVLDGSGMESRCITDPMLILDVLAEQRPDLILLDYHLPHCTGVEMAQIIRQHPGYVGIPILFLSADADEAIKNEAMVLGGDEFVRKPIEKNLFINLVISKARRSRALNKQMMCDGLTGLYNHTYSENLLEREVERVRRMPTTHVLSFVMLDIDFFKKVNDTYGHVMGDSVIRILAQLLKNRLRKTDIVGRYGGEEFAVIMPDTPKENAKRVIDDIRKAFSEIIHRHKEQEFTVTLSAGIASTEDFIEAPILTKQADTALYQAKQSGRNQVCLASRLNQ